MNKISIRVGLGAFALVAIAILSFAATRTEAGQFPQQSNTVNAYASTTAYTLTWGASTKILGTSTRMAATATLPETFGRTAIALQTINCPANGSVFVQFNDAAAATSTGMFITASSTLVLGDTVPMAYGALRVLSSGVNCTLLVTEFRSAQ